MNKTTLSTRKEPIQFIGKLESEFISEKYYFNEIENILFRLKLQKLVNEKNFGLFIINIKREFEKIEFYENYNFDNLFDNYKKHRDLVRLMMVCKARILHYELGNYAENDYFKSAIAIEKEIYKNMLHLSDKLEKKYYSLRNTPMIKSSNYTVLPILK